MPELVPQVSLTVSPASYWIPIHFPHSAWVEHAPFAFWLIDALRPRTVVELGTHNGFSFFVFAEAVRRLGLETTLTAIDSWEGDDQAGFYGESVYGYVQMVTARDFPNARLLRAYFADAAPQIDDGTVDLLHIDGRHSYEDVKEDFETYRSKVSERGVVIFHDTHEYQEGFGVHQFWSEIASSAPSFEFHHGHGLGVLALGTNVEPRVLEFLEAATSSPLDVRHSYEVLGREVSAQAEHDRIREEAIALRELSGALESEVKALRSSTSWRLTAPLRRLSGVVKSGDRPSS